RTFVQVLAPFAPHHAEEMWSAVGEGSVHEQAWPGYDEALIAEEEITLVVQVNGKLRARVTVPAGISEDEATERALARARVRPHVA
ncbi:class I tRNA ligase family protein, partial [Shigella sonnei]|uniref:class I tRNA ligase family protein n=1 Tax=Shigella sonnei TaxID=624 RepID=UPI0014944E9B